VQNETYRGRKTWYTRDMRKRIVFILLLALGIYWTNSQAVASTYNTTYDEYEGYSYDSLVNQLSESPESEYYDDPFNNVKFHLGVALVNTSFFLEYPQGSGTQVGQRGIQTSFGIDLFSPRWVAEGAYINFTESEYENARVAINEFDLKFFYNSKLSRLWSGRMGLGLAGRYLKIRRDISVESDETDEEGNPVRKTVAIDEEYSTPASMVFVGVNSDFTDAFSLGLEAALRRTLVSDAPDYSAFDVSIRIDGHF
jgi:hypothetical protein